jgi:hypothetical protein
MKNWIGKALILIGTFGSGGLAGAIYSHYANRPEPTIISPSVSTITIANPQTAGSLIPDLKVQVGNEVIGSLYALTVTFDVVSGPYVDGADVAITFTSAPHIYGKPVTSAPSPLHSIACTPIENGLRCRMSPLKVNSGGPFRVSIATDKPDQPKVDIVAKDVQLATVGEITAQKSRFTQYVPFLGALAAALAGLTVTFVSWFTVRRFQDVAQSALQVSRLRSNKGYLVVIAAKYGSGDHRLDVTKQLNDAIIDDKLHIFAGNQLAGDPCPNVSKDLWVSWQYKGQKFNKTVREAETLDLP